MNVNPSCQKHRANDGRITTAHLFPAKTSLTAFAKAEVLWPQIII